MDFPIESTSTNTDTIEVISNNLNDLEKDIEKLLELCDEIDSLKKTELCKKNENNN